VPVHNQIFTLSNITPTKIVAAHGMNQEVHLNNLVASASDVLGSLALIFIGNENVNLTNSIRLDRGESKVIKLGPGDELFAVSNPSSLLLGVLRITQD
jgi:hypothetical protein